MLFIEATEREVCQTYHPCPGLTRKRKQLVQTDTTTDTTEFCGSTLQGYIEQWLPDRAENLDVFSNHSIVADMSLQGFERRSPNASKQRQVFNGQMLYKLLASVLH